jgi:hypothetical protein
MSTRYSPNTRAAALAAYSAGRSLDEAAADCGVNRATLFNWLQSEGLLRSTRDSHALAYSKGKGRALGQAVYDEVGRLYSLGLSGAKIDVRLGLCAGTAYSIVKRSGRTRPVKEALQLVAEDISDLRRIHTVDAAIFERELTPSSAWALGVIFGDGCVAVDKGKVRWLEVAGDLDVCQKVGKILGSDMQPWQKGGCWILKICSPALANSLSLYGVVPRKSRIMPWPSLPDALLPSFVRGFWDADGCVYVGHYGIRLSAGSMSRSFMTGLLGTIQEITGTRQALFQDKQTGIYRLAVSGRKAYLLARWLWGGSEIGSRGDRKYGRALELGLLPASSYGVSA